MATAHAAGDGTQPTGAAPSLGLVLAGVALVASVLPWTGQPAFLDLALPVEGSVLAAALALVATVAFSLRRHGTLDRPVGSIVAGLALLAVAGLALARLTVPALGGGTTPTLQFGLPIAGLAGLFGTVVAVADLRALPDDTLWTQVRAVGVALLLGFAGFFVSTLIAYAVTIVPLFLLSSFGQSQAFPILTAGSGLGMVAFTYGYLRYRNLGFEYVDIRWPTRWDAGYTVAGLFVLFLSAGLVSFAFTQLGLPTADSSIQQLAEQLDQPAFLLPLIPLSFLAIGPGEELVYRNVVQKYLYESFSRPTAVVVASVAFAAVHFQQYANPNPIALLSTLFIVFVLSLVLGGAYYLTENLLVPILIHGTFNAIQFYILYLQLTGGLPSA